MKEDVKKLSTSSNLQLVLNLAEMPHLKYVYSSRAVCKLSGILIFTIHYSEYIAISENPWYSLRIKEEDIYLYIYTYMYSYTYDSMSIYLADTFTVSIQHFVTNGIVVLVRGKCCHNEENDSAFQYSLPFILSTPLWCRSGHN